MTEFVNGTPERRTSSDAEYFQVDPPHYNAADGIPAQQYRIDAGSWRRLPASRVFYTGKLRSAPTGSKCARLTRPGPHEHVSLARRFRCPARSHAGLGTRRPCWYPPHLNSAGKPMRWDWQIGRVTPLQRTGRRAVDIYDIDGFLTTRAEVGTHSCPAGRQRRCHTRS